MPLFLGDFLASFSPVAACFIVIILFIWGVFNLRYNPKVVELGPTILTTIGIFGTFLGVALGLAHFDTANVQASVPALLTGLKTAFWASVFGVGAAVQIKLREFYFGTGGTQDDEQPAENPVALLVAIRDALAGPGDASLLSQMKLARQDTNDRLLSQLRMARSDSNERLDGMRAGIEALRSAQEKGTQGIEALRAAQTDALRQLAAGASHTLVEALQKVVLSFNDKVAAQFGENYRDLNAAVTQLLAWQIKYRETTEAMTRRLDDTVRVVGYAASDMTKISDASAQIGKTAERVNRTMEAIAAGEQRLAEVATGVAKLTEAAAGRIPVIEGRLGELVSQMTSTVRSSQLSLNEALTESADQMRAQLQASQQGFAEVARSGASAVLQNQQAIADALAENAAVIRAALAATQQDLTRANESFSHQTIDMMRAARDQMTQLDRDVAGELTRTVAKLSGQLKSLSAQLQRDGTPTGAQITDEPPKIALVAG